MAYDSRPLFSMLQAGQTMNGAAAHNPRGLSGYSDSIAGELLEFQRKAFPRRREDWIESRWRWMFLRSAARLGVAPMVWLYRTRDGIMAHQGAIAVQLKAGNREYLTGWFVETFVLGPIQGKAVGPMLIAKAKQDLPFNLSLGQTPQMRAIQFALGWRQVAPLSTYVFLLNPGRLLASKIRSRPLRSLATGCLSATQQCKSFLGHCHLDWTPVASESDRFGDAHDDLWERVKAHYPCAVVRNASYLNWKYVEQPGQDFIRLDIRRNGELVAAAVLLVREPDSVYRYRRGLIVDLVLPGADREIVWATLRGALMAFQRRHVDLVVLELISKPLSQAVRSFGFIARKPTRFLLVCPERLPEQTARLVLSADNWLVTLGDSDIDRPW